MLSTAAANLLLWDVRKKLADQLAADKKRRLRDKQTAVPNLATLANVSSLNRLNNIPKMIEELQTEMEVEIPPEQVGSSDVTPQSATEFKGCSVAPIADPLKSL